ncbi:MAG: hypothetical protein KUG68_04380, partial [Flavobacteriaceae bacterium]|nr:hypothetical protein [Flavobacteriaceae bacterium]
TCQEDAALIQPKSAEVGARLVIANIVGAKHEGASLNYKNEETLFKGKYVIVWKKIENDWKIYLDIWNKL